MDKKTSMASSLYFSEKASCISSQTRQKVVLNPKTSHYKVQIVNQNLEDAIKQVKTSIKENPQWTLNVQAVADQYKTKDTNKKSIINQSLIGGLGNNPLPQSKKEPIVQSVEPQRKPDFAKLKYTERMKRQYDDRMRAMKEKRMKLEVSSLEKQMKARLQRKIKQNVALKQKAKLLQQLQEKRDEETRLLDKEHLRKRNQQQMLHQSNVAKVQMLRRYKKKTKKRELSESLSRSQESKIDLHFKEVLTHRQKQQRKQFLVARYRMLRTASQGSIKKQRADTVREIRTNSTKRLSEQK